MTATFDNMYCTTTTSDFDIKYDTADNRYNTFYNDNYNGFKIGPDIFKDDFRTELIINFNNIIKELGLTGGDISIAAFTKYGSDIERDLIALRNKIPCYVHFIHPIKSDPQNEPVGMFLYDMAIISDILGNALSKMANANIVKEALTSLKQGGNSYLIIESNLKEKANKSTEIALNEEDLTSLAIYAGAKKISKLKCMEKIGFPLIIASNGD